MEDGLPQIVKDFENQNEIVYDLETEIEKLEKRIITDTETLTNILDIAKLAREAERSIAYLDIILTRVDTALCETDKQIQTKRTELEIETDIYEDLRKAVSNAGWKLVSSGVFNERIWKKSE